MPVKKTTENKELSFEKALERLGVIADELENKNPALEDALALYEEGSALLKECAGKLEKAQTKITELTKSK